MILSNYRNIWGVNKQNFLRRWSISWSLESHITMWPRRAFPIPPSGVSIIAEKAVCKIFPLQGFLGHILWHDWFQIMLCFCKALVKCGGPPFTSRLPTHYCLPLAHFGHFILRIRHLFSLFIWKVLSTALYSGNRWMLFSEGKRLYAVWVGLISFQNVAERPGPS